MRNSIFLVVILTLSTLSMADVVPVKTISSFKQDIYFSCSGILSDSERVVLEAKALNGDTEAAGKVAVHHWCTAKDNRISEYWARIAAQLNVTDWQFNLAFALVKSGHYVECLEAKEWLKRAQSNGITRASEYLENLTCKMK